MDGGDGPIDSRDRWIVYKDVRIDGRDVCMNGWTDGRIIGMDSRVGLMG